MINSYSFLTTNRNTLVSPDPQAGIIFIRHLDMPLSVVFPKRYSGKHDHHHIIVDLLTASCIPAAHIYSVRQIGSLAADFLDWVGPRY